MMMNDIPALSGAASHAHTNPYRLEASGRDVISIEKALSRDLHLYFTLVGRIWSLELRGEGRRRGEVLWSRSGVASVPASSPRHEAVRLCTESLETYRRERKLR